MDSEKLMIPLPPKRFQNPEEIQFDPIRHKPWFRKLATRRRKIPLLDCAYIHMSRGITQRDAAAAFSVHDRELRSYTAWKNGESLIPQCVKAKYQAILDAAYASYQFFRADRHIRTYIEAHAPLYGMNPRHCVELWETDPCYYPSNYEA